MDKDTREILDDLDIDATARAERWADMRIVLGGMVERVTAAKHEVDNGAQWPSGSLLSPAMLRELADYIEAEQRR